MATAATRATRAYFHNVKKQIENKNKDNLMIMTLNMEAIENINKDITVLRIKLAMLNRSVLSTLALALALRDTARVRLRRVASKICVQLFDCDWHGANFQRKTGHKKSAQLSGPGCAQGCASVTYTLLKVPKLCAAF